MSEQFQIREARADDVEPLVNMRLRLHQHTINCNPNVWQLSEKKIAELPAVYRDAIENSQARLLVVEENVSGNLIGMGLGRILTHTEYIPTRSGKIDDVWIGPQYRRKGLCEQLLSELIEFFKINNIDILFLDYVVGNREAEAVWSQFGLTPVIITTAAKLSVVEANVHNS